MNILKHIKSTSWSIKKKQVNPISVYKIFSALEKPKDWNKIAESCSNNPNHEHFGKPAAEITKIWQAKGAKGANRGNVLDDAITYTCQTGSMLALNTEDTALLDKYANFYQFYQKYLSNKDFSYVGSEIWLNSEKLNVICRLDALFQYLVNDGLLIFDWKNNEKFNYSDRWNRFEGPMSGYDVCEANKFTLQTYIYRYILEEYGFSNVSTRVLQLTSEFAKIHKPAFDYDAKLIEEIAKYSHEKLKL